MIHIFYDLNDLFAKTKILKISYTNIYLKDSERYFTSSYGNGSLISKQKMKTWFTISKHIWYFSKKLQNHPTL